ncbi:RNA recognition motif domain [Dillenia turbinata]|uniref:RNA recognition motif domain n=1 Tax=Dillenia turbinata TaxID=194707 RepID=A0AAN8VMF6_9MAGN
MVSPDISSDKCIGLNKRTTTEKLREAFSQFGNLVNAKVVTDRVSGYSKGFGFVQYASLEEAAKGIEGMDGKFLDGWVIFAEYARPRAPPPPPGNNGPAPPYYRQ